MKPQWQNHQPWKEKQIDEAVEAWKASEWVLDFLRTRSGVEVKPKATEEIVEWYRQVSLSSEDCS